MHDSCSMQIVCRREDTPLFEQLGFSFESGLILKMGDLRPPSRCCRLTATRASRLQWPNRRSQIHDLAYSFDRIRAHRSVI